MVRTLLILLTIAAALSGAYWFIEIRPTSRGFSEDQRILDALPTDSTPTVLRHPDETELFEEAARRAWDWVDGQYESETGLYRTVEEYPVATVWDIASGLAALFSARGLDLLDATTFDERMARALDTLERLSLYDNGALNKRYATATGTMLARTDSPSARGFGWSAIDLGRLLVWLRIVADAHPQHAAAAAGIVDRLDMNRLVRDDQLWGEDVDANGRARAFPEGFIGYEQYAALGFELWGHRARESLSLTAHTEPLIVWDQVVLVDRRPRTCLTSEPFVLAGLELGWRPAMSRLALAVLAAQEARHRRTGELTITSEDASTVPPWYFYYYCIYGDGGPFSLAAPAGVPVREGPRTVSAKAAYGWYVLAPSEYTALALNTVAEGLRSRETLIAGLEEGTGATVGPPNINTAAVMLEAALFLKRGRPLLTRERAAAASDGSHGSTR